MNGNLAVAGNVIGGPYMPDYEETEVRHIDYSIRCVKCNYPVHDWEAWQKAVDNPGEEVNLVCNHCLLPLTTVHDEDDVNFTTTAR